jgi:hypothetical protein
MPRCDAISLSSQPTGHAHAQVVHSVDKDEYRLTLSTSNQEDIFCAIFQSRSDAQTWKEILEDIFKDSSEVSP